MKQNTKRLDYLDACKGIGIIFIVFCHVMEVKCYNKVVTGVANKI